VVGDEATLKVHVHTDQPDAAVSVFEGDGEVQRLDVGDMREGIAERERRLAPGCTGVVAVAAGDGLKAMFRDLGAHVVDGGATLNPSTYEILAGIHEVPADEVLVLPNSPNVILAAQEAAKLSEKPARVVATESQQAAIATLVAFDSAADAAGNVERFEAALAEIRWGAVAPAARADSQGRFVRGDAVGFVGDQVVAWGGAGSTLAATVAELAEGVEIVTIFEGQDAPIPLDELPLELPDEAELELHRGGQPHYWWLIAAQ
jgi:dihydroxyacetone kinase-like predicted kinase